MSHYLSSDERKSCEDPRTVKNFRISLYQIIGECGRYFDVTVRALSREGAIATMRKTYEPGRYCLASVKVEAT